MAIETEEEFVARMKKIEAEAAAKAVAKTKAEDLRLFMRLTTGEISMEQYVKALGGSISASHSPGVAG